MPGMVNSLVVDYKYSANYTIMGGIILKFKFKIEINSQLLQLCTARTVVR